MERDSRKIIARLKKEGWELLRVGGSHHQFRDPATGRLLTVPHPKKDLALGLVHSIYKIAGWRR